MNKGMKKLVKFKSLRNFCRSQLRKGIFKQLPKSEFLAMVYKRFIEKVEFIKVTIRKKNDANRVLHRDSIEIEK